MGDSRGSSGFLEFDALELPFSFRQSFSKLLRDYFCSVYCHLSRSDFDHRQAASNVKEVVAQSVDVVAYGLKVRRHHSANHTGITLSEPLIICYIPKEFAFSTLLGRDKGNV